MLRIRFLRVGKKNRPSFRLVVTPRRTAPQSGRFLEILGFYNPIEHVRAFKKDRIQYWLSQGAQPSDGARNMLISEGVMEGAKVAVHKVSKKKEEDSATAAESNSTESKVAETTPQDMEESNKKSTEKAPTEIQKSEPTKPSEPSLEDSGQEKPEITGKA